VERTELFVGGRWVGPSGPVIDVTEAATEEVIGRVALGAERDVDAAVAAAAQAQRRSWPTMPDTDVQACMHAWADGLEARARDTARLVTRQNGMPITLSIGSNGYFPAMAIRYYADMIARRQDDVRPGANGTRTKVTRSPAGVIAAIIPWNYPQALAAMKLAPALAARCSVVLKPPPETSLDAFAFADAALEAGIPSGVINIVPGDRDIGAYLVSHPDVDKVAFTGSTAAGRVIAEACGRLLRPVTLELGGKSAAILAEDVDLNVYLNNLVRVSLPNSGQTCHASTRILAPRSRYAEIVDAITEAVHGLRIGNPLDRQTQIGPLVSSAQRSRVMDYIASGRASGARLTAGGASTRLPERGWFVEPTVFADVDNSSQIAREEIFGPVLCIVPYADEDDAVRIANDSAYGLAGTIWTADEDRGLRLAERIVTGTIGVNHYGLDLAAPFGGVKASGMGHELGPEGLAAYERVKSVYLPAATYNDTSAAPASAGPSPSAGASPARGGQ
jgi:aldehyde dehydrogenase (NAD+)